MATTYKKAASRLKRLMIAIGAVAAAFFVLFVGGWNALLVVSIGVSAGLGFVWLARSVSEIRNIIAVYDRLDELMHESSPWYSAIQAQKREVGDLREDTKSFLGKKVIKYLDNSLEETAK